MKRSLLHLFITLCAAGLVHADQTIRSLQQTLKDQGFYYGTVTGEKSAETTAAIRRYQIRSGLQVTGEINPETLRSLSSSSNSVATASRSNSKPAAATVNSVHPDASASLSQTSLPSFRQPDRQLQTSPPYSATFYQSPPLQLNRRMIAGAQYQLMTRGYYRSRVDGKYGPQTGFALRAFQSSAGLPMTGRPDIQTLDALGLSDTSLAYVAPAPRQYETWIPVRKFKHGKWKVKWKKYHRSLGSEPVNEDRQPNPEYGGNGYDK
jgi:peptidoglycan hydrolase-like protein with peptidoglycan-binding domain